MTTKEISAAAKVSDGTIFSVFRDKEEVLLAALAAALDPTSALAELAAIDPELPLRDRLTRAVEILRGIVVQVWQLSGTLQLKEVRGRIPQHSSLEYISHELLPKVLEPSRDELRIDPAVASWALIGLVSARSDPVRFQEPLSVDQIVDIFLDGARVRPHDPPAATRATRRKRNVGPAGPSTQKVGTGS